MAPGRPSRLLPASHRGCGARPELRPASSTLPGPLPRPPPITLHVPCVVVTSVSENSSSCSSVTPQAACPGTSTEAGLGLEPRGGAGLARVLGGRVCPLLGGSRGVCVFRLSATKSGPPRALLGGWGVLIVLLPSRV